MRPSKLYPGEKDAILEVLRLAKQFGYGNMIAHLKRAWAVELKQKYGGSYEKNLQATEVDAYPEAFDVEKL